MQYWPMQHLLLGGASLSHAKFTSTSIGLSPGEYLLSGPTALPMLCMHLLESAGPTADSLAQPSSRQCNGRSRPDTACPHGQSSSDRTNSPEMSGSVVFALGSQEVGGKRGEDIAQRQRAPKLSWCHVHTLLWDFVRTIQILGCPVMTVL